MRVEGDGANRTVVVGAIGVVRELTTQGLPARRQPPLAGALANEIGGAAKAQKFWD